MCLQTALLKYFISLLMKTVVLFVLWGFPLYFRFYNAQFNFPAAPPLFDGGMARFFNGSNAPPKRETFGNLNGLNWDLEDLFLSVNQQHDSGSTSRRPPYTQKQFSSIEQEGSTMAKQGSEKFQSSELMPSSPANKNYWNEIIQYDSRMSPSSYVRYGEQKPVKSTGLTLGVPWDIVDETEDLHVWRGSSMGISTGPERFERRALPANYIYPQTELEVGFDNSSNSEIRNKDVPFFWGVGGELHLFPNVGSSTQSDPQSYKSESDELAKLVPFDISRHFPDIYSGRSVKSIPKNEISENEGSQDNSDTRSQLSKPPEIDDSQDLIAESHSNKTDELSNTDSPILADEVNSTEPETPVEIKSISGSETDSETPIHSFGEENEQSFVLPLDHDNASHGTQHESSAEIVNKETSKILPDDVGPIKNMEGFNDSHENSPQVNDMELTVSERYDVESFISDNKVSKNSEVGGPARSTEGFDNVLDDSNVLEDVHILTPPSTDEHKIDLTFNSGGMSSSATRNNGLFRADSLFGPLGRLNQGFGRYEQFYGDTGLSGREIKYFPTPNDAKKNNLSVRNFNADRNKNAENPQNSNEDYQMMNASKFNNAFENGNIKHIWGELNSKNEKHPNETNLEDLANIRNKIGYLQADAKNQTTPINKFLANLLINIANEDMLKGGNIESDYFSYLIGTGLLPLNVESSESHLA